MNYLPYASSAVPTAGITIPSPISTGVSLSERFRHLSTPQVTHRVGGVGGGGGSQFGLGLPQNIPHSVSYAAPVDNRAFAIALAKRAQIQALQLKRKTLSTSLRGRGRGRITNLPVTARLGLVRVKNQQVMNPRSGIRVIRGSRGARGGGRGGLSFIQRLGGTGGKSVVVGNRLGTAVRGNLRGRGAPGRFQKGSPTNTKNGGGRGGTAAGKWKAENKSKEDLDNELDSYMSKSKTRVRSNLDKELDAYMLEARAQAEAVAAAVLTPVGGGDNDVVMTEA